MFNAETGAEAMTKLLPHRPDAVFAANDLMAVGVLQVLRDAGVSVPDDIAVVGFDDLPASGRRRSAAHHRASRHRRRVRHRGAHPVASWSTPRWRASGGRERSRTVVDTPLVIRSSTRSVDGTGPGNAADGTREVAASRAPAVTPTSGHENRRATS